MPVITGVHTVLQSLVFGHPYSRSGEAKRGNMPGEVSSITLIIDKGGLVRRARSGSPYIDAAEVQGADAARASGRSVAQSGIDRKQRGTMRSGLSRIQVYQSKCYCVHV